MKKSFKLINSLCLILLIGIAIVASGQIASGEDQMITDEDETIDSLDLPAGAIAPGSLPFEGEVALRGNPASGNSYDTNVSRETTINDLPGSTQIELIELSLKSVNPIVVSFSGGGTKNCNVFVTKSSNAISDGTMTFNGDFSNGGTFTSTLKIIPEMTFECFGFATRGLAIYAKATTTVLDMGSPFVQIALKQRASESMKKIQLGIATRSDLVRVSLCNIFESEQTETQVPLLLKDLDKDAYKNVYNAYNIVAVGGNCGIIFTGGGGWGPGGVGPLVGDAGQFAQHQTMITNQAPIPNPNPTPIP